MGVDANDALLGKAKVRFEEFGSKGEDGAQQHSDNAGQSRQTNGSGHKPVREPIETKASIEWSDPQPLPRGLPPVELFVPGLLPPALRPWIMDIAERMQCPPDFPAAAAIVALGSVIGRRCGIRPKRQDDWTVVPNLWGAVIGRPGVIEISRDRGGAEAAAPPRGAIRGRARRSAEALAGGARGRITGGDGSQGDGEKRAQERLENPGRDRRDVRRDGCRRHRRADPHPLHRERQHGREARRAPRRQSRRPASRP